MENQTHDFNDGHGPIEAHQHVNPDGSLGDWVPDAWEISPRLYVLPQGIIPMPGHCAVKVHEIMQQVSTLEEIGVDFDVT